MGIALPDGLVWRTFHVDIPTGMHGWFLINEPTRETHYVLGIFRNGDPTSRDKRVFINLYHEGRAKEVIYFDDEPLTEELRDRLLPIGLMNRIDV